MFRIHKFQEEIIWNELQYKHDYIHQLISETAGIIWVDIIEVDTR